MDVRDFENLMKADVKNVEDYLIILQGQGFVASAGRS